MINIIGYQYKFILKSRLFKVVWIHVELLIVEIKQAIYFVCHAILEVNYEVPT